MSRWQDFIHRYVATPVDMQGTVLPPDVVPPSPRHMTAEEAREVFDAETNKPRGERDMVLIQRCLDAVGEHPDTVPPLGIRTATPDGAA